MTLSLSFSFFFNDTSTTEIYTLSLHDALPISVDPIEKELLVLDLSVDGEAFGGGGVQSVDGARRLDRKSTRLNSSHVEISYAVFCLKKKKKKNNSYTHRNHPDLARRAKCQTHM